MSDIKQNNFRTRDPFPKYPPAGVGTKVLQENAKECIAPRTTNEPSTPEHIKKYRKSYKQAYGQTITHYGKVQDPLPELQFSYGIKTKGSEHVDNVIPDKGLKGVTGYMRELKEDKYHKNKNEPLGKTISRNYQYPNQVNDPNFRFGVGTVGSEQAKDVLYNPASISDGDDVKNLYIKSHKLYDAGEQKKRDYNWKFDPNHHVFGKSEKRGVDEARYCLYPETVENNFPKTTIVKKNVEDHRDFAGEQLGKVKNLGQTNPKVTEDFVYGYKPRDKDPWDAAKCLRGQPNMSQIDPDENLGKSTKHGFRNQVKDGDEGRVFGIPTIRKDVVKPAHRSVANTHNYGDEPSAIGLLVPERFADYGIEKEDFVAPLPKEDIRKLFSAIGYNYKPGKFEGMFMRAQELTGCEDEKCSVKNFI